MEQDKINKFQWMRLPRETRSKLSEMFGLERTGVSEIRDDEVISDGYSDDDLSNITKEKLIGITKLSDEFSFQSMWELLIAHINPVEIPETIESEGETLVFDKLPEIYCTTCTSKKGRHKKGCPKYK
jgi:hypothetical protein